MTLAFGSDHAGFDLRQLLVGLATEWRHDVVEFGAQGSEPYDYPDAADAVVQAVLSGQADMGVLVCGTGIGVSIRANRHKGIRAALCCSPEAAKLAIEHNHANVLCLGARTTPAPVAEETLRAFLGAKEDCAERHARRVAKLDGNL